jgi:hypothetical protein
MLCRTVHPRRWNCVFFHAYSLMWKEKLRDGQAYRSMVSRSKGWLCRHRYATTPGHDRTPTFYTITRNVTSLVWITGVHMLTSSESPKLRRRRKSSKGELHIWYGTVKIGYWRKDFGQLRSLHLSAQVALPFPWFLLSHGPWIRAAETESQKKRKPFSAIDPSTLHDGAQKAPQSSWLHAHPKHLLEAAIGGFGHHLCFYSSK